MLKYTGHPLVDVGAAAIAAFSEKRRPEDVTVGDLEKVARYLEEQYLRKTMASYIVCVFPNSAYVNPTAGADKKAAFLQQHLYAFREEPAAGGDRCALCGEPAVTRAFRQHVPMITGEGVLNFFPNAAPGLPLCAGCMISIAALPLGALRCAGRALLVHADNPALTYELARRNVTHNRRLLQMEALVDEKYPDAKQARTRLIERLRDWATREAEESHSGRSGRAPVPTSLTAYHLTNSGQGPDLTIYHLPSAILTFLRLAEADTYRKTWHGIVRAGWRLDETAEDPSTHRNYLYDDLFNLPGAWPQFVRTYFLRRAFRAARKDDPRSAYALARDLDLVSWPLTELFLKGVVDMEEHRVKAIRQFGDRVAEYIAERNAGFWRHLHLTRRYDDLRVRLINSSQDEQKAGRAPLIGFDDFITIFEYGENAPRADWKLARDLVLIRVIEQLHARQWFKERPDQLEVSLPEEETTDAAAAAAA